MGDRIKKNSKIIIISLCVIIIIILIPITINFVNKKIKEYVCDNISITDAWQDLECREYFIKTMGK